MRSSMVMLLCSTVACSSDTTAGDAGIVADAASKADAPGAADGGPSAAVVRGQYLIDSVLSCGDCHTPRGTDGKPIIAKYLSGVECFVDAHPPATDGMGCLHTRNLTSDVTGLKGFTDADVKTMLTTGVRPSGKFLSPVMPYWIYHTLTDDDANAIVAYLRTVAPVAHAVPANEPPFADIPAAAALLGDSEVPSVTSGPQQGKSNGRYLATLACLDCHSPDAAQGAAGGRPQDLGKPFQGNRDFKSAALGLPPSFPTDIYSANLTPDATGIMGWTVADIVRVLHVGVDNDGKLLCPPMPFGPMGGFGKLTEADATDIANYLLNLPAVQNARPSECFIP